MCAIVPVPGSQPVTALTNDLCFYQTGINLILYPCNNISIYLHRQYIMYNILRAIIYQFYPVSDDFISSVGTGELLIVGQIIFRPRLVPVRGTAVIGRSPYLVPRCYYVWSIRSRPTSIICQLFAAASAARGPRLPLLGTGGRWETDLTLSAGPASGRCRRWTELI